MFADTEKNRDQWYKKIAEAAHYSNLFDFYDVYEQIGKGKFSTVFKCKNRQSGGYYALKEIVKGNLDDKEIQFIRDEIQIFNLVSHPSTVQMVDMFESVKKIYIVMPLVKGGELFDYITENKTIDFKETTKMIF